MIVFLACLALLTLLMAAALHRCGRLALGLLLAVSAGLATLAIWAHAEHAQRQLEASLDVPPDAASSRSP